MDSVSNGHYYRKQLSCKSRVIAWSHRSRFQVGLQLLGDSTRKLLDYGSGDGTFLAMAANRIQEGWGADLAVDQIKDCRTRLAPHTNLHFCSVDELADPAHDGRYDVVTCMETLEHCTTEMVENVLENLARLVSPDGRAIISVPIEIGPTFVLKWILRKMAAWRGLSDYRHYEPYSISHACRMIFARRSTLLPRPVYQDREGPFHSHYGFNWRWLQERVSDHFSIAQTVFSPLGCLGGSVSSQAWFVCCRRVCPAKFAA
jgi:SAM-dependent methyltransferase